MTEDEGWMTEDEGWVKPTYWPAAEVPEGRPIIAKGFSKAPRLWPAVKSIRW